MTLSTEYFISNIICQNEGKIRKFHAKMRDFVTTTSLVQEILKEVVQGLPWWSSG